MPSTWIYFIALVLLLVLRVAVIDTTLFAEWLWYRGQPDAYYFVLSLRDNQQLLEFVGGWPLPMFVVTVFAYWIMDDDEKDMGVQFLMLPLVFVPFSIVGHTLVHRAFDVTTLYIHPLVLLPAGYLYVLPWMLFVWVFTKLKLVV